MMVAQGGFDKKEEVENPSEVLLNPSDPEATFRYKAINTAAGNKFK